MLHEWIRLRAQDTALFDSFLDEWLASVLSDQVLELDVSNETLKYERSTSMVLNKIRTDRSSA